MKKVLHLTLYLDIGGLERMIWILGREQIQLGWKPYVFVYEKDSGDLAPHFRSSNIPVTFFYKGRGFSFSLVRRVLAHLKENEIHLIHSHDLGALIYATMAKLLSGGKVQVVHTQHSFQHLTNFKMKLYERVFPWLADRLVCVSEDLRRTYLKLRQPLQRLRLVPNGVDFNLIPATAEEKLAIKKHLIKAHSLPADLASKKWGITLGRLASVKGPEQALALWNQVDPRISENTAFLLVGPEVESGMLQKLQARARAGTYFPGPTMDPQLWLRASDFFVSASTFEGLPLAGLEAVAAELPMLLSQIPGHSRFQKWAAFFPLSELKEGARIMENYLQTGKMGAQVSSARRELEAGCGARKMAERYQKIYLEVTN